MDGWRQTDTYYGGLAQVIMEADNSCDLPLEAREAGGGVLLQTQMPENQGSQWKAPLCRAQSEFKGPSTRNNNVSMPKGRRRRMLQLKQRK